MIGALDSVTTLFRMFESASAFDQDLGWCLDGWKNLDNSNMPGLSGTPCASTSCGIVEGICVMTDSNIGTAVAAWIADASCRDVVRPHFDLGHIGCDAHDGVVQRRPSTTT